MQKKERKPAFSGSYLTTNIQKSMFEKGKREQQRGLAIVMSCSYSKSINFDEKWIKSVNFKKWYLAKIYPVAANELSWFEVAWGHQHRPKSSAWPEVSPVVLRPHNTYYAKIGNTEWGKYMAPWNWCVSCILQAKFWLKIESALQKLLSKLPTTSRERGSCKTLPLIRCR